MTHYDYIFAGGGCAAFSLIYYLNKSSLKTKSILVIDPQGSSYPSKTWCYWAEKPLEIHPPNQLVQWNQLSFGRGKEKTLLKLKKLTYYHIQASDFFRNLREEFDSNPNINFFQDKVISCQTSTSGFIVTSEGGKQFSGDYFFDSRAESADWTDQNVLKQQFVGWKISLDYSFFDPDSVTWMDILSSENDQFSFGYILPYDTKHALVEYTCYSEKEIPYSLLEDRLKKYLDSHLESISYTPYFEEKGRIPMSTQFKMNSPHPRWINLGTRAGWSRPSTGFTFQFIQDYCRELVAELEFSGTVTQKKMPSRHYFYDNILLNIVKKWPKQLEHVFVNLFTSNSPDHVLQFLQAKTGVWEELSLLSKVRFYPFLKSLWHYEKH
ncbi:lycopene cyclase family protein [Algoriphagus confluentis]|uniref:Lycopene cyclase family protein n=2 Tax=Algoriphagus confluentis TaxID=1697556 RepID=A0ABQ6PJ00_9BACT|nr:lycopene cyclase family protein [Algoriphagus confluentis]